CGAWDNSLSAGLF
nr:immunoglobulin light chain junction region [Macaca mulatta]MPN66724.1 immunoglobulin light chain junction region [Macaca mulatta]MPN67291.1 immunoglobulin light chain junction region [Macaca mulatta]MPN68112.1 immunoglobulin light chain junction region [Macaca mulatta]MPN68318.1 immunoglobulin light chain junction region [Macaca mulatta]